MTRHVRPRREVKPEPLPMDIRMMQQFNRMLMLALMAMGTAALVWWLIRLPVFVIAGITMVGQIEHNNEVTIRANVTPQLKGDFFTFDLQRTQKIFETVPWVRHAVVEREFPNRLRVKLEEHQPVAYWGQEAQGRLLNKQGEVFDANWGEIDQENLPQLSGPDNQSAQVLDVYQVLEPEFKRLGLSIRVLELTARGSWRARLQNASVVEMGRGTSQEILNRVKMFTLTLAQVSARYEKKVTALESADLRHDHGYALRMKGLSTVDLQTSKK